MKGLHPDLFQNIIDAFRQDKMLNYILLTNNPSGVDCSEIDELLIINEHSDAETLNENSIVKNMVSEGLWISGYI